MSSRHWGQECNDRCEPDAHSDRMHQEFDPTVVTQTVGGNATPHYHKQQQGGSQELSEEST